MALYEACGATCLMCAQVDPDMKAGLWMICKALKERNYLESYDIYMRLAVGVCSLLYSSQPGVVRQHRHAFLLCSYGSDICLALSCWQLPMHINGRMKEGLPISQACS